MREEKWFIRRIININNIKKKLKRKKEKCRPASCTSVWCHYSNLEEEFYPEASAEEQEPEAHHQSN